MKILIAYYSRSGHTAMLAQYLQTKLESNGHTVLMEKILPVHEPGKWLLVPPLWASIPLLPLYLWLPSFRSWWFKHYPQAESSIQPLVYPDVSEFDIVCLGMPKWLYLPYPMARYLKTVRGLSNKKVGAFTTFCGPPMKVFEMEMLFVPLMHRIHACGAKLCAKLAVSSHFHEFFIFHEMEYIFRLASRLLFCRSLRSFTMNSEWGKQEIDLFCRTLQSPSGNEAALP